MALIIKHFTCKKLLCIVTAAFIANNLFGNIIISGFIDMNDTWKKVIYISDVNEYRLINSGYDGTVVDSIQIDETGHFKHSSSTLKAGLYRFNIQEKGSDKMAQIAIGLPNENFLFIYFNSNKDTLEINMDAQRFNQTYSILKGSLGSVILRNLQQLRGDYFDGIGKIYDAFERLNRSGIEGDSLKHLKSELLMQLGQVAASMQMQIRPFLDTVTHVEAGLVATMYYNLGDDFGKYVGYFDVLHKRWLSHCTGNGCNMLNEFGNEIYVYNNILPLASKVPDIALPDTNNRIVSLYDIDAELILIEFWASWCGPCRREAKTYLIPLYDKYHKLGFEIFSVSADTETRQWKNATVTDKYEWITTIDTQGIGNSPLLNSFLVQSVPVNYLIDKDKKIIAKDIHGTALELYLDRHFEQYIDK